MRSRDSCRRRRDVSLAADRAASERRSGAATPSVAAPQLARGAAATSTATGARSSTNPEVSRGRCRRLEKAFWSLLCDDLPPPKTGHRARFLQRRDDMEALIHLSWRTYPAALLIAAGMALA